MASSGNLDFPHSPPPPPSSSPNDNTTIVVIVFVSFCGILFFSFLAAVALCCFLKKKKKKKTTPTQEADVVHVDEHLKMKKAIVEGHHGPQAVVLELEDDVHADEIVRKNDKPGPSPGEGLCCPFKKKKTVEETDIVHVDEHLKMKEANARGQHHGPEPEAIVLEIDNDVHADKVVIKK